jgi:hypothetical protein
MADGCDAATRAARSSRGPCLYSRRVNAEFNWWLLIVGLVIGAGLVWLILADTSRREADVTSRERAAEGRWIADELRRAGRSVDDDVVAGVLDLHAAYLAAPPPDDLVDEPEPIEAAPERPVWSGGEPPRSDGRDQPSPSRTG